MTENQIIEFLKENADFLCNNDIIASILQNIGWMLAKGLKSLIDICQDLYDRTFGLVDITTWSNLNSLLEEYEPLIKAIMVLSMTVLGIMYAVGKNKKHNFITSILIFAVVFTSSNYLFTQFNTWTKTFKNAVVGTEDTTSGTELIRINLYDLVYIDDEIGLENMKDGNRPQYTSLLEEEINYIDITEVMDPEDFDGDTKSILEKRLVFKAGEQGELTDCYNGVAWTDLGNQYYYRYHFQYFTFYLNAVAVVLVYICLSYKNIRIIYELFTSRILAALFSADVSNKKKITKILEGIRDSYFALCFTAISLKSYFLFMEYLNARTQSDSVVRGILSLMLAFCVIDGANIMEKITGVDAGLSSFTGKMLAGMQAAQGIMQMKTQHDIKKSVGGNGADSSGSNSSEDRQNVQMDEASSSRQNHQDMDRDLNGAASADGTGQSNMQDAASGFDESEFENRVNHSEEQNNAQNANSDSKYAEDREANYSEHADAGFSEEKDGKYEETADSGFSEEQNEKYSEMSDFQYSDEQDANYNGIDETGYSQDREVSPPNPDDRMMSSDMKDTGGNDVQNSNMDSAKDNNAFNVERTPDLEERNMFDKWDAKTSQKREVYGQENTSQSQQAFVQEQKRTKTNGSMDQMQGQTEKRQTWNETKQTSKSRRGRRKDFDEKKAERTNSRRDDKE